MAARVERRLAAVLAADVAGYSSLMEQDEDRTLERLRVHHKELLQPLVAEHRGRVVKLMGDGMLCEFASVVDAVGCAAAIQRGMAGRETDVPEAKRILVRIGVNLGDVIVEGRDIYGDGVNVAARLEQLAEPGGVVISGTAFDQLRGELGRSFAPLGEQRLKNIERPVRTYRMITAGSDGPRPPERPALPLPDRPSLAVLPFDNLSGDPEQGYFADGIVEDITTALSRISGLFVIARGSSFAYRGRAVDVRQVGRELGVRYVLEGSVRKAGERVRVTGQLIEAATGAHLWADRFDATLTLEDVFDLQDRVAAAVAGAIEPTLRRAEVERARRKPTGSLDAYDLYLRALPHVFAYSAEDNAAAMGLLDRTLALDPGYALARAYKAWLHGQRYIRGWTLDEAADEADRLAAEAAGRQAVADGTDDPTALAVAGVILALIAGDYAAGLATLGRARALNPNSAMAWGFGATVHCLAADYPAAAADAERALRLSPLDPMRYYPLFALACAALFSGRPGDAVRHAGEAIQASPGFDAAHCLLVASLVELGRIDEARAAAARLMAACPNFTIARRRRASYRDARAFGRYLAALEKAGLPG